MHFVTASDRGKPLGQMTTGFPRVEQAQQRVPSGTNL